MLPAMAFMASSLASLRRTLETASRTQQSNFKISQFQNFKMIKVPNPEVSDTTKAS